MKVIRIALAATAACLLTAALAGACDGHKKASQTTASADAKGGDVQGNGVVLTGGGSGCAKSGAMTASGGGCAKGEKMAGKAGCAKKAGCCAKGATTTLASVGDTTDFTACTFKPGSVAFKGTVLCNHCDLQKSETCKTMFRTENGCVFTLAGDKADGLRKEAVGGTKLVRLKGNVAENGELTVDTYRVVKNLGGASAM